MTLLCRFYAIVVTFSISTMAMSVIVEKKEAENVGGKSKATNYENQSWVGHNLWLNESLNGFQEDGQAKGDQKDAVD